MMIPGAVAICASILAQADTGSTASGESANMSLQVQSVWDFVLKGGPMMVPILLCSLIAMAVVAERMMTLRRSSVIPPKFRDGLENVLAEDGLNRDDAIEYCRKNGSCVASIFATAIKRLDEPVELLEKHITDAGEREVLKLRRYLRLLMVIGAIAPLMGLLGTIFGMIEAFQTVATSGEALGKTELLAKGIYEAMITTAAGLLLAIPVLVAYHGVSAKIDSLVLEIDLMTVDFIETHGRSGSTRPSDPEPTGQNGQSQKESSEVHSEPVTA